MKAQEVFEKLPVHDVVSWSALIGGYARLGHGKSALNCYEHLRQSEENLSPNQVTLLCVLNAKGGIGALYKGQVHGEICNMDFFVQMLCLVVHWWTCMVNVAN